MYSKNNISFYSLWLGIGTSLVALLFIGFQFFKSDQSIVNNYVSEIQNEIKNTLLDSNNQLNSSNFNEKKFIYEFKDSVCVYWSNYDFIPSYSQVKNKKILLSQGNFFLVNSKQNKFELIKLFSNSISPYKIENNGFSKSIFNVAPNSISLEKSQHPIFDLNNNYLFSVEIPKISTLKEIKSSKIKVFLLLLPLLFLGVFMISKALQFSKIKKNRVSFKYLAVYIIILRLGLLLLDIPNVFYNLGAFKKGDISNSIFNNSLGDLLLNAIMVAFLLGALVTYLKSSALVIWVKKANKSTRSFISILLVILAIFGGISCLFFIKSLYLNSGFSYRLSASFEFTFTQFITLSYFVFLTAIFFLWLHFIAVLFYNFIGDKTASFSYILFATILSGVILFLTGSFNYIYVLIPLYFFLIIKQNYIQSYYDFNYNTWVYLIVGVLTFCLLTVNEISILEHKEEIALKRTYGSKILLDNNSLSTQLLNQKFSLIQKDSLLTQQQNSENYIIDTYLSEYKENYSINFKRYSNTEAKAIKNRLKNTTEEKLNSSVTYFHSSIEDLFDQYFLFIKLNKEQTLVCLIKSKLRNILPELNTELENRNSYKEQAYSYGVFYKNNKLISNKGGFNYSSFLKEGLLTNNDLFLDGIVKDGYRHTGVIGNNQRLIVVSQPNKYFENFLSNLSFLYLICLFVIATLLGIYWLNGGFQNKELTFSTKIQLYLNLAFLTPILFLVLISLNAIRNTLIQKQEDEIFNKSAIIANDIQLLFEQYDLNDQTDLNLTKTIEDIARTYKQTIHFYKTDGNLLSTSQPEVFQANLKPSKLPYDVLKLLLGNNEKQYLKNMNFGSLDIKNWFINLENQQNQSLGIISLPVYNFNYNLNEQLSTVAGPILTIFVVLFIVLLALAQMAAKTLTQPLKHIALKLKQTKLDQLNEPLEWKANDEIGVLTDSYNEMLDKIEESKFALAQSEKQTAWREMAKQVAHEIKNPLTPMKLSIQQLQRTLVNEDKKVFRSLNSINEQIDNIAEIANSFSEFAKMPMPKSEKFDLNQVVQKVYDLYSSNKSVTIEYIFTDKQAMVYGDPQLISRIISNLIINGIQAIDQGEQPKIKISLVQQEERAILSIQDNGKGIPSEIQKKVFVPNFTTKSSGSGLGLAMAKRGLEQAGGNIWFETAENQGSTFFVDLPLA